MKKKIQVLQYLTASLCVANVVASTIKTNLINSQKVKITYNLKNVKQTLFDNNKITLDSKVELLQENIYKTIFPAVKQYYNTIDEVKKDKSINLKILVKNEVIACDGKTLEQVLGKHYEEAEQYQISIKLNITSENRFFIAEEQQTTYYFKIPSPFALAEVPDLPKNDLYSKLATNNNLLITTSGNTIYAIKANKLIKTYSLLPNVIINDLAIDSTNNIYVATNKGVWEKNAKEDNFKPITGISDNDEVKVLAISNLSKMLYAGSKQGKLYTKKIDGQVQQFNNDQKFLEIDNNKNAVMKIVIQQENGHNADTVYVATSKRVCCFDGKTSAWKIVAPGLSDITDLAIDSGDNAIYVSTKTGIYVAKIPDNNFTNLLEIKNITHIMISEPFERLYFTNEKNEVLYCNLSLKEDIFVIKGINGIIKDIILHQNKIYVIAQQDNKTNLFIKKINKLIQKSIF